MPDGPPERVGPAGQVSQSGEEQAHGGGDGQGRLASGHAGAAGDKHDQHHHGQHVARPRRQRAGHLERAPDPTRADQGRPDAACPFRARGEDLHAARVARGRRCAEQAGQHPRQLSRQRHEEYQAGAPRSRHQQTGRRDQRERGSPGRGERAEPGRGDHRGPGRPVAREHPAYGGQQPPQRGVPGQQRPLAQREPLDDVRVPDRGHGRHAPRGRRRVGQHRGEQPVRTPAGQQQHTHHGDPEDDGAVDHRGERREHRVERHGPRQRGAHADGVQRPRGARGEDEVAGQAVAAAGPHRPGQRDGHERDEPVGEDPRERTTHEPDLSMLTT